MNQLASGFLSSPRRVTAAGLVLLGLLSYSGFSGFSGSLLSESLLSGSHCQAAEPPVARRVPWTTSRIQGSPEPPSPCRTTPAFPNLKFDQPTVLTPGPDGTRWYLAELPGRIYSFPDRSDCQQADAHLFIDLAAQIANAQHIYGLAFHPDFSHQRFVYICYLAGTGFAGDNRVSRFRVTDEDPPRCDPASEQILIQWATGGHNGGCLEFGPDGYLYVSTGDGASPSPPDPHNTGQDISDLMSSILRIDVNQTTNELPYAIPPDNPFVNTEGARPEVWAYGLRNPWKMSFDRSSGDLWLGDVGWDLWEMVFRVRPGDNCGWSVVEGGQTIRPDLPPGPTPIQPPVMVHPRSEARSVTGGYVYRGQAMPALTGQYIYGDFVTGRVWALRFDGKQATSVQELVDTPFRIISFAEGPDHELSIVDYDGTIHRLMPNTVSAENSSFPRTLSETGLFASVADHQPAPGVVPYTVNAEPWADGAHAKRFVALPNESQLSVCTETNLLLGERPGGWRFPPDSVLVRTLFLDTVSGGRTTSSGGTDTASAGRPVETQILHRDGDLWRGYTYLWNADATDASLVAAEGAQHVFSVRDPVAPGGSRQQTWILQGRGECLICHSPRAGSVLGFQARQLPQEIPADAPHFASLDTLVSSGLISGPVDVPPVRLVNPRDETESVEARVRSLLDVNCVHCHGNGGGSTSPIRLQHHLPLSDTGMIGGRLTQGDFGIQGARVIVPGDPYRSILYYRMAKTGPGRMPHMGSRMVDESGLKLIHEWIRSLPQQPADGTTADAELQEVRQQQAGLLNALADGGQAAADAAVDLLRGPDGALMLLNAVHNNRFSAESRKALIDQAVASSSPHVREVFEQFVPEQQRRQPPEPDMARILAIEGDPRAGERLFFGDSRLKCQSCHRVGDRGTAFGPALTQVGRKLNRRELFISLMNPSARIDPEFAAFLLVTKAGVVHTGLLVERKDNLVVLKSHSEQLVRVPESEIEEISSQSRSIMPDGALRELGTQEIADLLTFLHSLR